MSDARRELSLHQIVCVRGDPQAPEFISRKLCIYSYTLKLQSLSKDSPFDAIHLSRHFLCCSNSFWTCQLWCLVVLLPFWFHPLHIGKMFPLEDFAHLGKQKKLLGASLSKQGGWGREVMLFLVKNCWILSTVWAGALIYHPSWNGQMRWKSLQKNLTEAERSLSQQRQLVHWYRLVPRTLT